MHRAGRSTPEDCAIVDAGLKALAFDSGPPLVWDEPAATYERASDELRRLPRSLILIYRPDGNAIIKGAKLGPCVPARPWVTTT